MTECEKLRSELKAYLDGQLSPAARIAMRLHLNCCEPCRKEIEEMRLMGTRMRAADSLEMSDVLRTRILASIPTTAPDKLAPGIPKWRERPVLIWGASASAVLAWFMFYPALSSYQNAPPRVANAASNTKQIGLGLASLAYTQDYDEQTLVSTPKPRIADSARLHVNQVNGTEAIKTLIGEDLPTERQVHKDASLTVEVANAEQQSEAVERLVKESKGYVAQNQLTTGEDNTCTASLTCKVPVDQFDTVMGQITRLGLLKGKTLTGEDITDKVSDEQETGHILRADIVTTEEKLKVHRRHSETVRDEETLRQLRIRSAQSQARLKMLTRLGALSEITVELDEKPKNVPAVASKPASPFMEEVSGTGQAAAHSFLMALRLPVQVLVWIVVYAPVWGLLLIAYRRMTR